MYGDSGSDYYGDLHQEKQCIIKFNKKSTRS